MSIEYSALEKEVSRAQPAAKALRGRAWAVLRKAFDAKIAAANKFAVTDPRRVAGIASAGKAPVPPTRPVFAKAPTFQIPIDLPAPPPKDDKTKLYIGLAVAAGAALLLSRG